MKLISSGRARRPRTFTKIRERGFAGIKPRSAPRTVAPELVNARGKTSAAPTSAQMTLHTATRDRARRAPTKNMPTPLALPGGEPCTRPAPITAYRRYML